PRNAGFVIRGCWVNLCRCFAPGTCRRAFFSGRQDMAARRGLPDSAHRALKAGETYQPYVSAAQAPAEFTLKALFLGIVFGIVFGAANAYLGLRAGLTISTSIPIAVMTVAAFHAMRRFGV